MKRIAMAIVLCLAAAAAMATDPPAEPSADTPQMPALPAGHPSLAQGSGAIAVSVVQGTEGGPAITGGKVTVELHAGKRKMRDVAAELDSHGVVLVENLPLMMPPLRPRVTVDYGGAAYGAWGEPMVAAQSQQSITVTVHETSEQVPDWKILGWQVVTKPSPEGLQVVEMVSVTNPSDRAYLSAPAADGYRRSVIWTPPAGSTKIWVDGALHDCCTKRVDGRLISTQPLKPGRSIFHVGYTLPVADNKAAVTLTPPVAVTSLRVFVPHRLTDVQATSLAAGDVHDVYGEPMRRYAAKDVPAAQQVALIIGGLPDTASATDHASALKPLKVAAAVGVGLFIAAGIAILLRKPKPAA